jgi:two-component sensor histidine kinase
MNESPDGLQLAALERSGGKVRIVWQEYEGEPVLHLRFWAESEGGRLVPTKSGVTFQLFEVPAVAEALAVAAESAADCIRERRRCGPQKTKR